MAAEGPHIPSIRRLSGQQQTPVLVWDGQVIAGSGAIVEALEARAGFPLARGLIARGNGVTDPDNVRRSFEITRQALDEVARRSAATG